MLLFEFERTLFKFSANRPAFEPLFQLPPEIGIRLTVIPHKDIFLHYAFSVAFIQPPSIRPNSSIARDNRS
ncbi:hypothetical protein SAMN05216366_102148 [Selenomonas ruminantium]|uniref:Uncharacterized protein n=1 Tax=Selenomonas ruminantium TaxID=971 RepID=A0A1H0N2P2_SELRU|nr:hypothetical protein SAMN05216366_102148 [Selenomonas ruminantium]